MGLTTCFLTVLNWMVMLLFNALRELVTPAQFPSSQNTTFIPLLLAPHRLGKKGAWFHMASCKDSHGHLAKIQWAYDQFESSGILMTDQGKPAWDVVPRAQ